MATRAAQNRTTTQSRTTKKPAAKKSSQRGALRQFIAFVIDKSPSMQGLESPVINCFNELLDQINSLDAQHQIVSDVEIVTFNENVDRLPMRRISNVSHLNRNTYRAVGSSTALLDAVGSTIRSLEAHQGPDTAFLVYVITDGQENASREFNKTTISRLIAERQREGNWTFAFNMPLGGRNYATQFGIPSDNVREWEQTIRGVETTRGVTVSALNSYYDDRSKGIVATKKFFSDASNVKASDMRNLDNMTGDFYSWPVKKEVAIRDFVEEHGVAYVRGRAFYELTKTEVIQDHKLLLIKDKRTGVIRGGDEVHSLLGLPLGENIKVVPGNHAFYSIFVKSTSVNRKLVRGTTLLYAKRDLGTDYVQN